VKIEIIHHKINKILVITQISTKPYIMSYHYQMDVLYKMTHRAYSRKYASFKKGHPWPKYKYTSSGVSFIPSLSISGSFLYKLELPLP